MSWGAGPEIGEILWEGIKKYIPTDTEQALAKLIVDTLEGEDCYIIAWEEGDLASVAYPERLIKGEE